MLTKHPLIFTGQSVRHILAGTKTQTRRAIKQAGIDTQDWQDVNQPTWGRETWTTHTNDKGAECLLYKADVPDPELYGPWCSPWFMPRHYSRLLLVIIRYKIERLHDISEADCLAELGAPQAWTGPDEEPYKRQVKRAFAYRWNELNKRRGIAWATNPLVFVREFRLDSAQSANEVERTFPAHR